MSASGRKRILALAGGVGGAKLAHGLAQICAPEDLTVVVNTGDDFEHLGLPICPDLDTVMYTLAGLANPATGWGRRDETWQFMNALERLGGPSWFRLGDLDMATHVARHEKLRHGASLSDATTALYRALDVAHAVAPMSDQPVRTIVHSDEGELPFQEYFVRRQCAPRVQRFAFDGAEQARPSAAFAAALADTELAAIVICPSNPFVSVAPILAVPGVEAALRRNAAPKIAVSPIVGGQAIKGPAAKMMRELNLDCSARGIADWYGARIDALVLDREDAGLESAIRSRGTATLACNTVMRSDHDRAALAQAVLTFAATLPRGVAR
ncbi:MAG: 2-phospho-L-lactate transferase [Alphaproteobacteria bacterium]